MSKKFFYVAALLAGLVFTGTSCADDKGDKEMKVMQLRLKIIIMRPIPVHPVVFRN